MFRYQVDEDVTLELQSPEQDKALFALVDANRDFIGKYLSWPHQTHSIEAMRDYMQRDLQGMATSRRWGWLILYQGQAAGRIGIFVTVPSLRECEIHYWLAEKFTGRGIVTRAARVIVDYAFRELNLNHVLIGFSSENHKSGAVAERLGFQYEVTLRDNNFHEGKRHNLHLWGIMADEWQTENQPIFSYPIDGKIHLRLHQVHHAPIQYELTRENLPELKKWFWWTREHSMEREQNHTREMLKKYAEGTGIMVGIWEENALIGNAGVQIDTAKRKAEIGYWLDKNVRGRGIMTGTVKALMHYAFDIRGLERFCLRAASENQASQAVAERLGLKQEAVFRESGFLEGRYLDHVQYSMLKNEWGGL